MFSLAARFISAKVSCSPLHVLFILSLQIVAAAFCRPNGRVRHILNTNSWLKLRPHSLSPPPNATAEPLRAEPSLTYAQAQGRTNIPQEAKTIHDSSQNFAPSAAAGGGHKWGRRLLPPLLVTSIVVVVVVIFIKTIVKETMPLTA